MAFELNEKTGKYSATKAEISSDDILKIAHLIVSQSVERGASITQGQHAVDYFRLNMGTLEREVFAVLYLDSQNCVICHEELFHGTIDGAVVYPREVVRCALLNNATKVMLVHNHPSGNTEPSDSDISITKRISKALELVDISILDHIIVSRDGFLSFYERRLPL